MTIRYKKASLSVLILLAAFDALASDDQRNLEGCKKALIYLTDHPEQLEQTIKNRKSLYTPKLREEWAKAPAQFISKGGEEVLIIKGFEVMRGFEKPYMNSIAKTAVSRGGRVLNVGFGIGHIDDQIQKQGANTGLKEHHIVELNQDVFHKAKAWREAQPERENIFLHQGDWNNVLRELANEGIQFDGIAYDAFPLEEQDLHRDFIPFLEEVIRLKLLRENSGIITFYMDSPDGFGNKFVEFAKNLGVSTFDLEKVEVSLPISGNQYWSQSFFLTPTLSGIKYGE